MDEFHVESIDDFKLKKEKVLGTFAYGKVYLCTDENTGKKLAVKCIEIGNVDNNDKAKKEVEKFRHEISLFKKLNHERVVEYYTSSCTSTTISIVMEFMEGGSLYDKISKEGALDERTASEKSYQILDGLMYLHSKNIIHRDIKGANILLDLDGNCKLADFGISKQIQTIRSQAGCKTSTGTPYWMSPEVIKAGVNDVEYGKKADIWSFGCTVLEMLTTKPPWFELPPMSAIFHIATRPTVPHLPDNSSTSCVTFVNDCFISDPALRPNASQLLLYDWVRR
ncbi:mitogen-activated protein kinase kinase kinase 2 isoform X1 [Hydra vulgaris]|uniref:mitogen-activated protein kinase kinase kinase 2 isoform X1 n=1 Tax=Hydra vulgaris TaxID=6087 RepID=UPI001F5FC381|nr:mitogen-activated protein kinase kinase kinase 2 [Hydra vulgaris]